MAIQTVFREDIGRQLTSIHLAAGGAVALVSSEIEKAARLNRPISEADLAEHLRIYRQGYTDALAAVAAAFGLLDNYTLESGE